MERLTKNFLSDIEAINKSIDSVAESAFQSLLTDCDTLAELESRAFRFDKYPDFTAENAVLCEMVASRVRRKADKYIDNEKSQHKIVLGE
ncbi:TPA: hypothetical protein TZY53_000697 [Streptococcus suis]|uniref:hypothetical protein n=1 Tax=Streptococcus suis TaxID=1307 RepID=UPI00094369E3|nr:hypothetical protein [Streptococcus suis]HEL1986489.1 hypothetical protein [Streptococcus suis]HEL2457778.1 hypothetical protein [Streptococcus suis]HEM3850407.1 hypothetical protein [Streptococcus suis]